MCRIPYRLLVSLARLAVRLGRSKDLEIIEPHRVSRSLRCALRFARSACLISDGRGVTPAWTTLDAYRHTPFAQGRQVSLKSGSG